MIERAAASAGLELKAHPHMLRHACGYALAAANIRSEGEPMKLPRREFLHLAAGAVALPAVSRFAWAQTYPTRPVRLIVGFPPAGGFDINARLMGQWLSERLGQQFVIENRPGAGGIIGTQAVVNAPADGYTLLLVGTANAVSATLYEKLPFDFINDIVPVAGISRESCFLVVHPSGPRLKKRPKGGATLQARRRSGKCNRASRS
jgi:hypothetical protein